ncbi:MAG TPA: ATP-binding protein [Gemmatimonadales bacterium]|nr:ATP-binding protein [Gemmatimonadales bacterium]
MQLPFQSRPASASAPALAFAAAGAIAGCLLLALAASGTGGAARVVLALVGAALVAGGAAAFAYRHWTHAQAADARRDAAASQLDRRISELFSLQELSFVLSESIQLDRIADQVARYASRFLQADGALVALADDAEAGRLRVAAAVGSLARFQGRLAEPSDTALVQHAIALERIQVAQGVAAPNVHLLGGITVRSAAVAPLRAQGVSLGALAVVDRREGPFTTEDLWLLSTVATQTSVVAANGRLFEMVRRSTEAWETAFNALAEGIAVVGNDGTVIRANRALAALAGVGEAELVGRNFFEIVGGSAELKDGLLQRAAGPERPAPVEVRRERDRHTLRLTAAPIAGSAMGGAAVILVEDVTEQRALEAQVIQNEKMALVGQLVSGVAHELNNPLTSIAGLAELLLEPNRLPEAPREHLRVIHEQAERASRIVRNLLTFARKGTPEKTAVDLNDVVARTSLLVAYELELRGIELDARLAPAPVLVLADRYELQQVLLNLLTNAVQAVSELAPGRARRITLVTAGSDSRAELRVADTGPGVPAAHVPHLFTPFFTTKAPGHGTGLGLSLSYGLIESHGGRLDYGPAPEGGAEFVVTLPAHEGGALERAQAAGAAGTAEGGRRRILVADDDVGVQRTVGALLAPDGHIIEAARTGEQALRLARAQSYDLVIADGQLTADGSRSFVRALLELRPEWRERLVVTGDPRASGAHSAAVIHWMAKPFNLRDLRALAGRILEG